MADAAKNRSGLGLPLKKLRDQYPHAVFNPREEIVTRNNLGAIVRTQTWRDDTHRNIVEAWCKANCARPFRVFTSMACFESEADAQAFRERWA